MENDIEKEEKIIAEIKRSTKRGYTLMSSEFDVSPEYIDDLTMLEKVLRLDKWSKETDRILKKNKARFNISWPKITAAASIVLILSFSYFVFNKNYITDIIVEDGFLRNQEIDPSNKKLKPQEIAYREFLNGKAYYHSKDYTAAISSFKKVLETPNLRSQYREAVLWHLCVAYLQNNDTANCQLILKTIETNTSPKYKINALDLMKLKTQLWLKITF